MTEGLQTLCPNPAGGAHCPPARRAGGGAGGPRGLDCGHNPHPGALRRWLYWEGVCPIPCALHPARSRFWFRLFSAIPRLQHSACPALGATTSLPRPAPTARGLHHARLGGAPLPHGARLPPQCQAAVGGGLPLVLQNHLQCRRCPLPFPSAHAAHVLPPPFSPAATARLSTPSRPQSRWRALTRWPTSASVSPWEVAQRPGGGLQTAGRGTSPLRGLGARQCPMPRHGETRWPTVPRCPPLSCRQRLLCPEEVWRGTQGMSHLGVVSTIGGASAEHEMCTCHWGGYCVCAPALAPSGR